MAPQGVCKSEPSENGEQKSLLNAPTSFEWKLSSAPNASYGSNATAYTHPSLFTSFPSAEHAPANGHAPLPRRNHDIFYPVHPPFPSSQLTGNRPNNFITQSSNLHPPASYSPMHSKPTTGPSQYPLLPAFHISDDESLALPPVEDILKNVAQPALKVAGTRRSAKSKGNAKALDECSTVTRGTKHKVTSEPTDEVEAKRACNLTQGCQSGSSNYYKEDLDILMQVTCEVLPIGARGWEEVGRCFNEMAQSINRPTCPYKSLELKLKNLTKTSKPTGSAFIPEHVAQALEIEDLINAKAGTVDLDDDDIIDINSDNDGDVTPLTPSQKKKIRNGNHTFLTNIGLALDPSSRQARQESFQFQFMQNQQIMTLTQQLRDAQRHVDSLSAQLIETERRYQEAERRADRTELHSLISTSTHSHTSTQPVPAPICNPVMPPRPAPRRESYHQDIIYPDGQATIWVGNDSNDDEYITSINDSPGTRRFIYPDPRNYEPSSISSSNSSSSHCASDQISSLHHTTPSPFTSHSSNDDKDAGTECSQSL